MVFGIKDCHYLINRYLQPIGSYITQYAKLIIVHTVFKLIPELGADRVGVSLPWPLRVANISDTHNCDKMTFQ